MTKRFENKVAFITGAGSGIGRETALLLAQEGGKIMVTDINEEGGAETVKMVEDKGGRARFLKVNVADYQEVKTAIAETITHFGRLDIGVNNAGIGGDWEHIAGYSHEAWDKVIAVNQTGVFYCMQEELKHMFAQRSGAIINVSSMAGMRALPRSSAYVASKHAVNGLTRTAALEYARFNIRVNAVCPVFTRTPIFEQMFAHDERLEGQLVKGIPMGRYGKPEEIAQAIAWLASDDASLTTGLCMPIDGGQSA